VPDGGFHGLPALESAPLCLGHGLDPAAVDDFQIGIDEIHILAAKARVIMSRVLSRRRPALLAVPPLTLTTRPARSGASRLLWKGRTLWANCGATLDSIFFQDSREAKTASGWLLSII